MDINFVEISPEEVKSCFPWFYSDDKIFFEVMQDSIPIGFYGIKDLGNDVGEISVYVNEDSRDKITKKVTEGWLTFPSKLGFSKILASTELEGVERFLKKMEKLGKFGVKYLFKNDNLHWFEVNYGIS